MKGRSKKGKRNQQFKLLSTEDAWVRFKNHTICIEEQEMRQRLDTLIAAIPDAQTAFGIEIRYHHDCWLKYINYKKEPSDLESIRLQGVSLKEAQKIFLKYVKQVVFEDHEVRTVHGLLNEYIRIANNHGHYGKIKSSYIKDLLVKKFGQNIGFHERQQKNKSEVVFDTMAASSYVEATLSSLGISDEQLTRNFAARLNSERKL